MKKLIFGCTLILSGCIGFVGLLYTCVYLMYGTFSEATTYIQGTDRMIAGVFVAMVITGVVLSVWEIVKDEKQKGRN